ncbi:DUF2239 family protein [Bordetella sp. BOR01]|uniref:DUF2239 family protein n=1 Tax=Bordetella sp. BOR01 TaxID=2854779 RepID=UPI001C442150|nr:DUF2239 family protein [Bordetella sp. BOR01]MBV7482554.1 DUF2239 family protein [Bordetella sp. BOR01]
MNAIDSLSVCTAFDGHRRIASGALPAVAHAVRLALQANAAGPVLIYSDTTGQLVDIDLRADRTVGAGNVGDADVTGSPPPLPAVAPLPADSPPEARGRGRPRLGVVSREVTLLPRHWEWLAAQPGGASVALRKLVEEARRTRQEDDQLRQRQEAAYRFMSSIAGDLAGFEEASRALFAQDQMRFAQHVAAWPSDVREHATKLAFGT